ncbi:MAG: hypothetical protein ABI896_02475 [Actinomycetota bacterium]
MKTTIRLAIAGCAALATLAFAGTAMAAYTPSLIATSLTNGAGKPTTMLIGHTQGPADDPTAKDTIYAPLGYSATLTQAVGAKIGDVSATLILRGGGDAQVDVDGQVIADNPALYATPATQCTGKPTHEAVWRLDITVAGTPLHVPIYVDHTAGAEATFASVKIQLCLAGPIGTPAGAQLLFALFDVNGVFTAPANTTDRVWRALFTPYTPGTPNPNPGGTTEGQALVPGRVSLKLAAKSLRHGRVVVSGRLLVDGTAFPGATIELYVGNKKVAQTKTKPSGRFAFNRKVKKKTKFRALVAFVGDLPGCPESPLPGVPQGCKSATVSFIATSNAVTGRRRR